MSNKVIRLRRWEDDEIKLEFTITVYHTNGGFHGTTHYHYYKNGEENLYLDENINWLNNLQPYGLMYLKPQILEAISEMRENNTGDGREQTKELVVPPKLKLKPHSSCKMNQNVVSNGQAKTETEDCQSELKQKLSTLDKNTKVLKTFKDNKCSVCLSDYKEILDEDNHIVIPSCGHPLCCKCADGILDSEKKECPQCRGQITLQSFNLMNFNADLEVDTENQRVFL